MNELHKLSSYDYTLPPELIAYYPLQKRGLSRMLTLNKETGEINDSSISSFVEHVNKNVIIVVNNTKVLPMRLIGKKIPYGGKVDCVLLQEKEREGSLFKWTALIKARRLSVGQKIRFKSVEAVFLGKGEIAFNKDIKEIIHDIGAMPIPPYIKRMPEETDKLTYQTVFAKEEGSIAAPTAGLHFSEDMIEQIKQRADRFIEVTLHVGYGTFAPVKTENITEHKMHREWFSAAKEDIDYLFKQKGRKKILAIGTTSVRVIETIAALMKESGKLREKKGIYTGETDIFIYPGYDFKLVDCLLTNFHMPKSTLLMLVSAFAGHKNIMNAYRHAVSKKYRFFSYGDAMLIC